MAVKPGMPQSAGPTRRRILAGAAATALAAAPARADDLRANDYPPLPAMPASSQSNPAPTFNGGPGLGAIAAAHGRAFGAAIPSFLLARDRQFAAAVTAECGLLMPDYESKIGVLQPAEGRFDFTPLDTLLAFARARRLPVRGQALIWHADMPQWALDALAHGGPDRARDVMRQHIGRVLAHTQGSIQAWDVVNEVIADPPGSDTPQPGPDELRETPWWRALGPDYIALALRMARESDPAIRIAINEYGLEEAAPHHVEKRRRFLSLVRALREAGVPLDQVGLQGHLQMVQPFEPKPFTAFCRELRAMGLGLVVTEMDVREHWRIPDGLAARDRLVADRVRAFMDAALDGGVETFITWGLIDKYSWLQREPHVRRADGLEHRGLPLDDDGNRTLYWKAMADSLARP